MHEFRLLAVDVVDEEDALLHAGNQVVEARRESAVREGGLDAGADARLVLGRLQAADGPEAHVAEAAVIEVDGVLGR